MRTGPEARPALVRRRGGPLSAQRFVRLAGRSARARRDRSQRSHRSRHRTRPRVARSEPMNAIAFLLALLALAYVGSILVGGRAIRGFGLASGAEYLVLGFVLGPQLLSVVSHSLIDGFQAVIMVGVSWLGLVLGVSYLRVAVRKVPL